MNEIARYCVITAEVGVGATAFMNVVAIARKRWFGLPSADCGLVGRWLAYIPRGRRWQHSAIAASAPIRGERVIGWITHYLVGIAFAMLLLLGVGVEWASRPTLLPALCVGILSVAAPFLLMQPDMGLGVAASRTPHPRAARIRSVISHGIFGFGLYLAAFVNIKLAL